MKKSLTIFLLLLCFAQAKAQDIIVKNDKTEIKAKIEEITETVIKYKKFEMLDGPVYNINKRDVFMVIYKNGSKEYMESQAVTMPIVQDNPPVRNSPTQNGSISNKNSSPNVAGRHEEIILIKKGLYSFQGEELTSYKDYYAVYDKYGYADLSQKLKNGKTAGLITMSAGVAAFIGVLLTEGNVRLVMSGVGIACLLGGSKFIPNALNSSISTFNARANKRIGFNSQVEIRPFFAANQLGNHIGVTIDF